MFGALLLLLFLGFGIMILAKVLQGIGWVFIQIVNPDWNDPNAEAPKEVTIERQQKEFQNRSDGRGVL